MGIERYVTAAALVVAGKMEAASPTYQPPLVDNTNPAAQTTPCTYPELEAAYPDEMQRLAKTAQLLVLGDDVTSQASLGMFAGSDVAAACPNGLAGVEAQYGGGNTQPVPTAPAQTENIPVPIDVAPTTVPVGGNEPTTTITIDTTESDDGWKTAAVGIATVVGGMIALNFIPDMIARRRKEDEPLIVPSNNQRADKRYLPGERTRLEKLSNPGDPHYDDIMARTFERTNPRAAARSRANGFLRVLWRLNVLTNSDASGAMVNELREARELDRLSEHPDKKVIWDILSRHQRGGYSRRGLKEAVDQAFEDLKEGDN